MYRNITFISICLLVVVSAFSADNVISTEDFATTAMRNMDLHNSSELENISLEQKPTIYSDDFNLTQLRKYWGKNSINSTISLVERPGFLRIKTSGNTIDIDQTVSQAHQWKSKGEALCYIDFSNLDEGAEAGIYFSNEKIQTIGVKYLNNTHYLVTNSGQKEVVPIIESTTLVLRFVFDSDLASFEYSLDGITFKNIGMEFKIKTNLEINNHIGFYCIEDKILGDSWIDVDWFYYKQIQNSKIQFAEEIY